MPTPAKKNAGTRTTPNNDSICPIDERRLADEPGVAATALLPWLTKKKVERNNCLKGGKNENLYPDNPPLGLALFFREGGRARLE